MRASPLAALFAPMLGALCLLASGCGFQLRGAYTLPYESLYLNMPEYSEIRAGLKRAIGSSGPARLVDKAEEAQAVFLPTGEARERVILSLSSAGRVRELRLNYRYAYRVIDPKGGRDLTPPVAIVLSRDMTYDDSNVNAKEQEEVLLWRDMQNDLLQQVLRRLAAAKPVAPPLLED